MLFIFQLPNVPTVGLRIQARIKFWKLIRIRIRIKEKKWIRNRTQVKIQEF